jgi:hypothetical protein
MYAGSGLRSALERALSLGGWFRSRRWGIAAAVLALASAAVVIYSVAAPQPLNIKIVTVESTGPTTHIAQMSVRVTNRSDHPVQPAFDVLRNGYNSTFWKIVNGPQALPAGQTAVYKLAAKNNDAEPSIYGGFSVVGYVNTPESFSVSSTYNPNLYHELFTPRAVDRTMPAGQPVTVRVQVYQRSGGVLHHAGVKVSLTQLVWVGNGPHPSKGWIDCGKRGKKGVAYTNRQGIATFKVEGSRPTLYPITYVAQLYNQQYKYVYSDSGNLNIRYGPSASGKVVKACVR